MKFVVLLALIIPAGPLLAQDNGGQMPGNAAPPLLSRPYEAVRDFFNFFAFANGVFDSNGAYLGAAHSGAGVGTEVGGGASGYHQYAKGTLSLDYRGDYRSYATSGFGSGTDQNLAFFYQRLGKRWNFDVGESAGIFYAGGTFYSTAPAIQNPSVLVPLNPQSAETRFEGTTLTATYQQSLRLSYEFSGSYFLNRYTGFESIGSNNIIGSGSTIYRITRRTSVSGTYSHSNYHYQHGAGDSNVDSGFATLSHQFASHWQVSASGGVSRSNSSGNISIPLLLQQNQELIPIYVTGHYNQTTIYPYLQGTVVRLMRHSTVSVSGGQSIGPGNGFYLASKTINVNGYYMYTMRRSNASVGGYYSRLSSAANAINARQAAIGIDASYSYNLIRHLGMNLRYDYLRFSNLGNLNVPSDSRISFGVYFTSKDIPIGWH